MFRNCGKIRTAEHTGNKTLVHRASYVSNQGVRLGLTCGFLFGLKAKKIIISLRPFYMLLVLKAKAENT